MTTKTLIVLVGPTAVGKSALGLELSKKLNCNIISADSRQFFKEISIGTAKPSEKELEDVKHYFINNKSILEDYNASMFELEVLQLLKKEFLVKDMAILLGGSGLYIDAVCKGFDERLPTSDESLRKTLLEQFREKGIEFLQEKLKKLDPEFYDVVDLNNSKRLMRAIEVCMLSGEKYSNLRKGINKTRTFKIVKIGLELPRVELYQRINQRVDQMMENGLLTEVASVKEFKDKNALKTVGYQEIFDYLDNKCTLEEAVERIKLNSRRYAKRQMTWFKKDAEIKWFSPQSLNGILNFITSNSSNGK